MKPHETYNPHNDPQVGLSTCCNAPTHTIPPCFGDPALTFCSHCNTYTEIVWKPMYEKVGKGIYRDIKYEIKKATA